MKTVNKRAPRYGDTVRVSGYDRAIWKVLGIAEDGLYHLTKLNSFHRLDYRGVDAGRLVLVDGVLGREVTS